MPLVLSLACLELGLMPAEAITAATINGAHCLGLGADRGRIAPGLRADLQLLDAPSYVTLIYHLGVSHVRQVWKDGVARL
jgi:imidazolonepropionase